MFLYLLKYYSIKTKNWRECRTPVLGAYVHRTNPKTPLTSEEAAFWFIWFKRFHSCEYPKNIARATIQVGKKQGYHLCSGRFLVSKRNTSKYTGHLRVFERYMRRCHTKKI